jgi:hypothetical protein
MPSYPIYPSPKSPRIRVTITIVSNGQDGVALWHDRCEFEVAKHLGGELASSVNTAAFRAHAEVFGSVLVEVSSVVFPPFVFIFMSDFCTWDLNRRSQFNLYLCSLIVDIVGSHSDRLLGRSIVAR